TTPAASLRIDLAACGVAQSGISNFDFSRVSDTCGLIHSTLLRRHGRPFPRKEQTIPQGNHTQIDPVVVRQLRVQCFDGTSLGVVERGIDELASPKHVVDGYDSIDSQQ